MYKFVNDARRFLLTFRHIIETAPLQLYNSALVFSPKDSIIKRLFSDVMPIWIEVLPIVEKNWSASLQALEGHSSLVKSISFSPDGRLLASASRGGVRLWDPVTGTSRGTLESHSEDCNAVVFSPDSRLLASASSHTIILWDLNTKVPQRTLDNTNRVKKILFSSNGRLLASASWDQTVKIWDLITGALQETFGDPSLYENDPELAEQDPEMTFRRKMTFSPEGHFLAFTSVDTIELWDTRERIFRHRLKGHGDLVRSMAFSPNGQMLASGSSDKTIRLWNPVTGACQSILEGHSGGISSLNFSPNGQLLASGSDDRNIKLWNSLGVLQGTLEGHSYISMVAFSPDSRTLASTSWDYTIRLWDSITGTCQGILGKDSDFWCDIAFSPNGELLASASVDTTINLWTLVAAIASPSEGQRVTPASYGGIGKGILAKILLRKDTHHHPATWRKWDSVGATQDTCERHGGPVVALAFSPNGQLLASGSTDMSIELWNSVGVLQGTFEDHKHSVNIITFSPDGRLLASASAASVEPTFRLWDLLKKTSTVLEGHPRGIKAIAFSPNGQVLAAGSSEIIRLWDPVKKISRGTLEGYSSWVQSMVFSPDGKRLISTHDDESRRIWSINKRALIQELEHGRVKSPHDNTQQEIDCGLFQIPLPLQDSFPEQNVAGTSYAMDSEREWVTFKGRRVLWLPPNRRPWMRAHQSYNNTLGLGSKSGQVTLLRFSTKYTPF